METRQQLIDAWTLLLNGAEPKVSKAMLLSSVISLLDSTGNKLSDTWPTPVKDMRNSPPGSPATGDRYAIGATPTGTWTGHANTIATWDGAAWGYVTPPNGALLLCTDTDTILQRRNSAWMARLLDGTKRYRTSGPVTVSATVLTEIGSLSGPVLAGRRYRVQGELLLQCDSAAYGITVGLLGPSSDAVAITARIPDTATHSAEGHASAFGTVAASSALPAANAPVRVRLDAVVASPAADDWITVAVASNNASATVTVRAGSTLEITDITD